MISGFQLVLNGTLFNLEELKAGVKSVRHTEFEKATIHFCRAWLGGQQEFRIETSGSTGSPKEILLHRDQMEASANLTKNAVGLQPGYTALLCLDTRYIAGQMMLVRAMVTGMRVIAVEPQANPFEKIPDTVIDFAAFVPYQLHSILQSPLSRQKLNSLKCILVGGAAIDAPTLKNLADLDCVCYASYGMTETISHIALQKLNGKDRQNFFQTLDGVSIRLDDRGCLLIRAQHLGDAEFITNDLVEITGPNQFKWLGRLDLVINSGGVKVIPEKIEQAIAQIFVDLKIPNHFFIAARPHATLGQHVILVAEGNMTQDVQAAILKRTENLLPRFEVPKAIHLIPVFEKTENGKLDRSKTLRLIPA